MAVQNRVVAILNDGKKAVGAGLLIDDDLVLTCAHVVNTALSRGENKTCPMAPVRVLVHGQSEPVQAEIDESGWQPRPPSKNGGDLCVLRLPKGTTEARGPARLREYADMERRPFVAAGYPENWNDIDYAEGTILGTDKDGLYMLASLARGTADTMFFSREERPAGVIHRGFSGGPVESGGEVVGLLTLARRPKDATAYMIPVTAFGSRFQPQVLRYANRVVQKYSHVRTLITELRKRLFKHKARLDLRLRYCSGFGEVLDVHRNSALSNANDAEYQEGRDLRGSELARTFRTDSGVTFLHAPGGAGKSSFLFELLVAAPDENLVPFLLDFTGSGKHSSAGDLRTQLNSWFETYRAFGTADGLLKLADDPQENMKPLLVLDGLNQTAEWADVLSKIGKLSTGALSGAAIVVADRLVYRGPIMDDEVFRHAVIPPLAPSAYTEALAGEWANAVADDASWRPIVSSPIFLNLLISAPKAKKETVPSRFQILNAHFRKECRFSNQDLGELADFAFAAYEAHKQIGIPEHYYNEFFDKRKRLKDRVEEKGLIHPTRKGAVEFRHQLLHDALAALKVASAKVDEEEKLLRGPAFDVLSLNAASSDAIEIAIEALQNEEDLLTKRDPRLEPREFLEAVFDWNYWITLQCVASFDRRGDSPLPYWVRHAIYGHNLERRFDPYLHTALRADRLKYLIPASSELAYRDVNTRDEIRQQIEQRISQHEEEDPREDAYRRDWLAVYVRDPERDPPFGRDDLPLLLRDSFIAWTTANVFRRFENPPEVTRELTWMYEISRRTSDSAPKAAAFRWRIVHALGRGTSEALNTLLAATLDPLENANVRYGAIRSLIELAVTRVERTQRDSALARLKESSRKLFEGANADRVRKELRRTCAFNEPCVEGREGWIEDWLGSGLQQFAAILREGEKHAKGAEASVWKLWADTASSVQADMGEWSDRKAKWQAIIDQDP